MTDRSIIEAWFVGAHADMGGGASDDGLSLYPLQWMLLESRKLGLVLEHSPKSRARGLIENPLELTVLENCTTDDAGSSDISQEAVRPWIFIHTNGIEVEMYDLRATHKHGNLQQLRGNVLRRKSKNGLDPTHRVRINWGWGGLNFNGRRSPFDTKSEGKLIGYREHGQ
jgi:hypothetical protein